MPVMTILSLSGLCALTMHLAAQTGKAVSNAIALPLAVPLDNGRYTGT